MPDGKAFRDGNVAVLQGQVIVIDPGEKGEPAILEPGPGLKLFVDEAEVAEATKVVSRQVIRVESVLEEGEVQVRVDMGPDGLEAYVIADVIPGVIYQLLDSGPRKHLVLNSKAMPKIPSMNPGLVEKALQEKGIKVGIDKAALESVIAQPSGKPVLIARGQPPVPGRDGYIELKFQDDAGKQIPSKDKAKIDWRELKHIPTVESGDVLAVKHQPILGKPGLSVTGQAISPRIPADVELVAGEGAEISYGGLQAVATRSGRPVFSKGKLAVYPLLIIERGVNLASGNIRFNGDIVVRGDVDETMSVVARGNIEIKGSCTHASLVSSGHITVAKNIIGGSVLVGGLDAVHLRCNQWWQELADGLEGCFAALEQIENHPQLSKAATQTGWGKVLSKLLDTKFTHISARLSDLMTAYQEITDVAAEEVIELLTRLGDNLGRRTVLKITNVNMVKDLALLTRTFVDGFAGSSQGNVSLQANYIQGCHVRTSGDIIISGKGCYQSNIFAGPVVQVDGQPGIVRGGIIQAQDRIVAKEAGSSGGSPTVLIVGSTGTIVLKKVHPNVTIQIGDTAYKFVDGDENVSARMDDDGILSLH